MARAKKAKPQEEVVEDIVEEEAQLELKEDENLPFTTGKWKDYKNYLCKYCQFSTLNEMVAIQHYAEAHAPKIVPPPAPRIIKYNRWGKPIKE